MSYGFVRAAAAVPSLKVGDLSYNADAIKKLIKQAAEKGAQFIIFPELCITSYTCADLFQQQILLKGAETHLQDIMEATQSCDTVVIAGLPVYSAGQLYNCAVVLQSGNILGVVPKTYIPGYGEFYEQRWFASGLDNKDDSVNICGKNVPFGVDLVFQDEKDDRICFGIEICEDLWVPIPPSSRQALSGAVLLFNLSASNEIIGKYEYRRELVRQQSAKCFAGYIYTSSGINESTTDIVFGGHAIISEYGNILEESERFRNDDQLIIGDIDIERLISDRIKNTSFMEPEKGTAFRKIKFRIKELVVSDFYRNVDAHPFVPSNPDSRDKRCSEIFAIQTSGLGKRFNHTHSKYAVIGISGGLDSTLALLVTAKAFDRLGLPRENIIAVTMPGFGTTDETYKNAVTLIKTTGASLREINIKDACMQHFKDIGHDPRIHDVTYENVQARERTQILMDLANKMGGLVIGTGDLSELAMGWCTYNGDHMSMYAVNCSVPKTLVKYLVQWAADNMVDEETKKVLYKILNTPISPELLPPDSNGDINQKTEDIIGPYELHDFFLYNAVRNCYEPGKILFLAMKAFEGNYDKAEIKKWLNVFYKRFFSQQFKRSCIPDGPKVGSVSLSPRGDWRMPSDAEAALWLEDIE
ncbi:MAG: NAD(+) synthase [Bacillota bacterium]|nr:NAD(+) synthase [Bacillota bacterium]